MYFEHFYEIFEKFIKVFILIDEKYKHTKKHEWQEIEDQVVENFCTEDCAKYENFHNFFFSATDEFNPFTTIGHW